MDRGVKDEAFVRRALHEADFDMGRWIANQASFNLSADTPLDAKVKAAVVTAVSVFVEKHGIAEEFIQSALAINTCGDARQLIDQIGPLLPPLP